MTKLSTALLFIVLIQFLSGCSQAYRSNNAEIHQSQQRQVYQPKQQHAPQNNQVRRQAVTQPRIQNQKKQNYSSQQTHNNAVVSQNPVRDLMTRIAQSTIGRPYKWGGNNPREGFDCSGLMSYVHQNALGLKIPRTAAQQRDKSRTISYAQLQPGDMLFFKTGKRSNHVGIYVGNRKFVHAATGSKEVKVASMDSSYWHKRFVKFGTYL